MGSNTGSGNSNARHSLLQTLAGSSSALVQMSTLGLVVVSGITSFFQTNQVGEEGKRDRDRAIHEIHQLYDKIDDFEQRQKQSLNNQSTILQTQSDLLRNQQTVLQIMRENQQRALRQNFGNPSVPGP